MGWMLSTICSFFVCSLSLIVLWKLFNKYLVKKCKSKVCLVGRTVIVTGANAGIGYETALDLAQRGARVILACRNEQRGGQALETILKQTQNENVVLKLLNLASIESIRKFANEILEEEEKIDILINNAGVFAYGEELTEDGLQVEWQSNYFGPVLLTLMLLDRIKKSSPSRIINVSSNAARFGANLSVKSLNTYENTWTTYGNTKLCNILFTQELARKLEDDNVSVFSLHPGFVHTEILPLEKFNPIFRPALELLKRACYIVPIMSTAEEGAQTSIYCACEQNIEHLTGSHFEYCQVVKPYKTARDPLLAKQIWEETLKVIKYDELK